MSTRIEKAEHQLRDINDLRHLLNDLRMKIIEARINYIYCQWKSLVIKEMRLKLNRPDMKIGKDEVPTLLHLCRLAIRKSLPASQLANDRFVENLPIPSSLKDYLRLHRCNIFESFLE